jgi:hypothetical protein
LYKNDGFGNREQGMDFCYLLGKSQRIVFMVGYMRHKEKRNSRICWLLMGKDQERNVVGWYPVELVILSFLLDLWV